ncbi:MAG: glycoside hydrolase family 3 C-terminal domain-containing protein [Clostridiales bacterium]|nr:glycoside hydrolase family 3 C-terminal domain-containing protein [Clostridiales bacterium]
MDVEAFVNNLSVAEKATLTHGQGAWHTNSVNGLPTIMMTDGPHGLRKQADSNHGINDSNRATCFPTASAVASSWNRANAQAIAESIADEAIAEDVSVVLGPGVNIKRSPLCGRNFEYFSEDPLLAGELATNFVFAMQAKGIGCSLKHFAVNSQETRRMTMNAIVDERALREIYLAAFERAVKQAQPYTIMAAYNKINGDSCALNKRFLTDILRDEWGFKGLVVSDWGASYDMGKAYAAGLDLEMPDGGYFHEQKTVKAVERGELDEKDLNRAASKVVELVQKCNVEKNKQPVDYGKHHELCRRIAADSAVLLKNDGILPLHKNSRLLVVGELAEKPRFQGAGSSHVNAQCKSFLQVLEENGVEFTYAKGYSVYGDTVYEQLEQEAAKLAVKCDTVLFFGGLTDDFEGEGYDRSKLDIPNCQQSLLKEISKHNPNVVFVAFGGSPFVTPWLDQVKALLNVYLGGEAVTEAIYDLVFGNVSPSGRLAETYPLKLSDTPCYNYFANGYDVDEHRESVFVGYRYYNTFGVPVQFPFGYGLSYTHFDYSNLKVAKTADGYDVNVTVKNMGKCDASEVVQIYVDNCDCGYMRPKRQLAGFTKVFVKGGESEDVTVHVESRAFSIFVDGQFRVVKGKYAVAVCKDVEQVVLSQQIDVDGEAIKGNDRELYPTYFERNLREEDGNQGGWEIDEQQFYALANAKKIEYTPPKRGQYTLQHTLGDMAVNVGLARTVLKFVKRMAIKQSPTKRFDDPVAQMICRGAMETPLISLMSTGGVAAKYVMFFLHHANRRHGKALAALLGKYSVE